MELLSSYLNWQNGMEEFQSVSLVIKQTSKLIAKLKVLCIITCHKKNRLLPWNNFFM